MSTPSIHKHRAEKLLRAVNRYRDITIECYALCNWSGVDPKRRQFAQARTQQAWRELRQFLTQLDKDNLTDLDSAKLYHDLS
jgi:histidine ammonia-lyase